MTSTQPSIDPPVLARLTGVGKDFVRGGVAEPALGSIDLELRAGRLIGLFGNNGAGKTTLTRLIIGTLSADRGRVELGGLDVARERCAAQGLTGICAADERSFYPRLSGRENLRLFGELRGMSATAVEARLEHLAGALGITDALLAQPFQSLSSGQRQRLNVARGLLHEPSLLVVDEALRSADPETVDRVSRLFCDYVKEGQRCILYTGHEFQGVEDLCDEIAVLDQGQLVLHGPRDEVLRLARPTWRLEFDSPESRGRALGVPREEGTTVELPGTQPEADRERVAQLIADGTSGLRSAAYREHCSVRELLKRIASGEGARVVKSTPPSGGALLSLTPPDRRSGGALLGALFRRDRLIYASHRFQMTLQGCIMLLWAGLIFSVMRLLEPNSDLARELFHGDGFSYVIVGVAFLQLSQICLLQMGSALREEQLQGTLEVVLSSGRSPLGLLLGSLTWPLFVRSWMVLFLLGSSAWLFGAKFAGADWLGVGVAALLIALTFTALGVLSAAFVVAFKRGDPVGRVLSLATLLVGGTYFPVESLPAWLRPIGEMHPMTHGLRAARLACLEGRGVTDVDYLGSLGVLGAMAVVVGALAAWGYGRALSYARRTGGLGHA